MAVGTAVPMRDAVARVTGTLAYAGDVRLPAMAAVRVLRSPHAYARIVRLDAAAAEQMPGVVAILTGADLGQPGGPARNYGVNRADQPIVAYDTVRFVGEPVALIAAETAAQAAAAARAIVVEYEPLPAVFDVFAAQQPDAPQLHAAVAENRLVHAKLRHGDLTDGFARADVVVEETFTSPAAQTMSLETHGVAAQWQDGRLTVWTGAQAPYQVQKALCDVFGLSADAVRVIVGPLGGGYGGKGHVRIEPLVAALAWKAGGRPVKLVLSRAEEFVTVTKHAAVITIRSGITRDGLLTARQITLHWNIGAYADSSPMLVSSGMVRAVGPYRIPAVHVDSYGIYTNLPSAAAFRGAMSSQATWAYESHLDTLAARIGMDPLEVRRRNLLRSHDHFCTGEEVHDMHVVECLEACAERLGWGETAKPAAHGAVRYGRGLATMMKSTQATSRSEARLRLADSGRVTLFTSTVEMGQGAHTVLAQITATALGVALDDVDLVGPDTAQTPFDASTSAARSTTMMGEAIHDGAHKLQQELCRLAEQWLERPAAELRAADGFIFAADAAQERLSYAEVLQRSGRSELSATGAAATKHGLDPETGQGVATPHWHQGAGACEIAVDTETGKIKVLRYEAASFAGKVVNPVLANLQNDGNVIFGLGPAVSEEIHFDSDGRVRNDNLGDYLIPSFLDLPASLRSSCVEDGGDVYHGIGEMTLPPVAPALANAIYDATGVRIYDLPLSPERVLAALRAAEQGENHGG
jgi:CO/xanthine dehydrogenase Mo-binding subunit